MKCILIDESAQEKVFTQNYAKLTGIVSVHTLIPHLIASKIITIDDSSDIRSCSRESEKIAKLLDYIAQHLKAGYTYGFYVMLNAMKSHGTIADQELANEMETSLHAHLYKGT